MELFPVDVSPLVGEYSLDISTTRQFKHEIEATIDGEAYLSVDGTVSVSMATEEGVSGSFQATVVNVDDGSELVINGSFDALWVVNCHVEADVPEDAPAEQTRLYVADPEANSEFCSQNTKGQLVN